MNQKLDRTAWRPLRLVLVGATLAVAWSAVCVIAGGAAPTEADTITDGLGSLSSITDPLAPVIEPVAAVATPVTAVAAPVVAPVTRAAAPVVAPVAAVAAPVVAPALTPVAAAAAPVVASVTAVVAPVVTTAAEPVRALLAPVTALATDVAELASAPAPVLATVTLASALGTAVDARSLPTGLATSGLMSSAAAAHVGAAGTSFTAPTPSAADTVLSQAPPTGGPFGAPQRGSAEQAILPTPAGSTSGQGASAGGPNTVSDALLATFTSVRLVSSGSASGAQVLPSAPTFDPGSSPD